MSQCPGCGAENPSFTLECACGQRLTPPTALHENKGMGPRRPPAIRAMIVLLWWFAIWGAWAAGRELYAAITQVAPGVRCTYALNCVAFPLLLGALSALALVWLRQDRPKGRTLGAALMVVTGLRSLAFTLLGDNGSRFQDLGPGAARVLLMVPALLIALLGLWILLRRREPTHEAPFQSGAGSDRAAEQGDAADEARPRMKPRS